MSNPALAPHETSPAEKPDRLAFVDVAKGIGIMAIIALHGSNRSSRLFTSPGDVQWWVLTILNRLLGFAVPMFFCISAFLWAKSQVKRKTATEGTWKRYAAILYPYLVWSCIYLVVRVTIEKGPNESISGILTPHNLLIDFIWGKAYFHLYFLSVLLQAALVFPLLFLVVKRARFVTVCALAFFLQALVFWSQTRLQYMPFVGSSVLWYLTSLLPAAWLGAHWPIGIANSRRLVLPCALLALFGGGVFLWLQVQEIHHDLSYSGLTNWVLQVFVFGAAFLVIALLALRKERPSAAWAWLGWLGAASLQFYVMHPLIMRLTSGPRITSLLSKIPGAPVWSYLLVMIGTFALVLVLHYVRLERFLFGRASPPTPASASKTER